MRPACNLLLLLLIVPCSVKAGAVDYARQVKPLLADRCYTCHGALKQQAGLRLDTAAALKQGGDSGPAISPGKSSESLLIERLTTSDADLHMPPEGEGSTLNAEELTLLKSWIDQGAPGPAEEQPEPDPREHWAFRSVVRPAVPVLNRELSGDVGTNPIDAFIGAELEQRGLRPQAPAEKRLLLRRVYLDLIGIPPTVGQAEAFLADNSAEAYKKVVNQLLDSPQYGERWGRHWMDVWRYSDWWGLGAEVRNSQKHIWHWRDWIVESLNSDVGYDEMLRQMIAADELYPNDLAKLRASGFLARQYFKFNRNSWMEETVEHTSKAFLGMTLNCARCHDHKYDPVAQRDYYRFRAFFEPYQVRTEQLPGELDYEKDGLPRAYDCNLDTPTYLFRRGDDKRPVTEEPLTPGLPPLLSFDELQITPVTLPAEAHQPGLRPWVLENHVKKAEQEIVAATMAVETARRVLEEAEVKAPLEPVVKKVDDEPKVDGELKLAVRDDFSVEQPNVWKAEAGDWKYANGKLSQRTDGDVRGVLELKPEPPVDFQARFKYTATGGKQWKSVGLSFDVAGENDSLVYLSCVSGGSKLQVSYKQNGAYVYPENGQQSRDVKLGEPQDVIVRARGQLINVEVNGQHALAYQMPIERLQGRLALITYDAQADFHLFELSALAASYPLKQPATGTKSATPTSVADAKLNLAVAVQSLATLKLQPALLRARAAADQARLASEPMANAGELIQAAALLERQSELSKAEEMVARRELELAKAEAAKKSEAEKTLAVAREAVEVCRKAVAAPGDVYTSLSGALKSVESNVEPPDHYKRQFPTISTGRRTALARWMTDRRHPTAARVAVNHIWLRHMGAPLVPTIFEFGRKGSPPTHPQLLDWLAVELMEHNWSMKHVHRLIVTSNAYRRTSSSLGAEKNLQSDAENRWYWRMNSLRMESESIRDSLLQLSGELDLTFGGPSIPLANTESSLRRSLYFVHSHNEHSKLLSMFDDANVLDCYRRDQSIVPQQALALSNSKLALEAAGKIAAKIKAGDDVDFIRQAFTYLLADEPGDGEQQACLDALADWKQQGIAPAQARASLVQSLLNHNDFITVR